MLLHDNATAHSAICVCQFLAQKMVAVLDHPPYVHDLAPPVDFFLFPCLKAAIKRACFADVNAIEDRVTAFLRSIPQEAFADCFRKLYERCQTCVIVDGDYFEGLAALTQMVACLPLVPQVRGSIPGRVVNFHLKIFNLGARRGGDVFFLIARLYIIGLD